MNTNEDDDDSPLRTLPPGWREVPIGVRRVPPMTGRLDFYGFDEVNALIAGGWRVVEVEHGVIFDVNPAVVDGRPFRFTWLTDVLVTLAPPDLPPAGQLPSSIVP